MVDRDKIHYLDLEVLQPNPLQPRGAIQPEQLEELVDSIKTHGILEPVVVAHTPAGFQIIAGERRWRAAKLAGLKKIPAVVKETTPQGMLEMALVENVQRTDLNALDRAQAFDRLITEFGLSNTQIAKRISKSTSYVSNTLRLLTLPDALKDGLLTDQITEGHARALAAIDNQSAMIEAYREVLKTGGSVRAAEQIARKYKQKLDSDIASKVGVRAYVYDKDIERLEKNLQASLSKLGPTKVKINRSRAETKVTYWLKGNFEDTAKRLNIVTESVLRATVRKKRKEEPKKTR